MSNLSIQPGGNITSEQRGYRRGLILGLTMAESMLLLAFCLLLAAGAFLIKEQQNTAELKRELDNARQDAEMLSEQFKQFEGFENVHFDEWRELTIANKRLQDEGIVLVEMVENAKVIKAVLERKLSEKDIETASLLLTKFDPVLADGTVSAEEDLETFAELVRKLMAAEIIAGDEIDGMLAAVEKLKSIKQDGSLPSEEELDEIVRVTRALTARTEGEQQITDALDDLIQKAGLYIESDGTDEPHDWPPIINLSEADKYFFRSGSAELSPSFEQMLIDSIAPQIAETATQYAVDVIEVIGHTDEQRMGRTRSNLDEEIKNVIGGKASPSRLQPADNAGLGLARAIAVAEVLKKVPSLQKFTILPMSGAQLIMPGDTLMDGTQEGDVAARRRIEIRVRKRNDFSAGDQRTLASN